jgi:hypothetical protein
MYHLAKKSNKSHLHKRTPRHGVVQPFACFFPGCELRFGSERALTKHRLVHNVPVLGAAPPIHENVREGASKVLDDSANNMRDDTDSHSTDTESDSPVDGANNIQFGPVAGGVPMSDGENNPVEEDESDDGFSGMPPEPEDPDPVSGHFPFPNFTFGMLAVTFDLIGLSDSDRNIIIACILTFGFDIEELRRRYSHDSMSKAIEKISRA